MIRLFFLLALLSLACGFQILPIQSTNILPTTKQAQISTQTPESYIYPHLVQIMGNVAVRDEQNVIRGWLLVGTVVQANCSGERCVLVDGPYDGLTIWRGCTSDNPQERLCLTK